MKRLFVCCDGTWNSDHDAFQGVPVPTNVLRFHNALDSTGADGVEQLKYYHVGVGANAGGIRRIVDGALGLGLSRDIRIAYKWLSDHYAEDSEIFVVGFSRGAFTARSLVGMMHHCGLPESADWPLVTQAWKLYRRDPRDARTADYQRAFRIQHGDAPPIRFLGVWETVGALGIPENVDVLHLWRNRYTFHDTQLSSKVQRAVHALAIDEQRNNFFPTLWTDADGSDSTRITQVWFPGVHADVGGGYKETELADATLLWMIQEAERCNAGFDPQMLKQLAHADQHSQRAIHGVLHNSLTALYRRIGYRPRSFPRLAHASQRGSESVSSLATSRQADPPIFQAPYRANGDASNGTEVRILASQQWNWTGVYMTEGRTYRFEVHGDQIWLDWIYPSSARGTPGTAIQRLFNRSKRVRQARWFELCGAITRPRQPTNGGVPPEPYYFSIGTRAEVRAPCSGYVYCFANDAAWAYWNNHGSIRVTITEL
ncbi:hypothetical protein WJ63_17580 [Burkholderia pyrrocinia]|nr:hypothetical protein WJ63_17580 [Burkholderia pyrrocinia]